jgi:hypothetical protein
MVFESTLDNYYILVDIPALLAAPQQEWCVIRSNEPLSGLSSHIALMYCKLLHSVGILYV